MNKPNAASKRSNILNPTGVARKKYANSIRLRLGDIEAEAEARRAIPTPRECDPNEKAIKREALSKEQP